ncbi:uncharacterized protein LOC134883246 [Eleginops maclovinus]|uniref:uncharacterized protein LOC134883246 n=1 Tax=Eleginops maclovinus TaxID=56733 RepID=UPI0030804CF6
MDTMVNAHRKFLSEYPERRVSYSLFCHLRLFWVVTPTLSERETCLCKMHENLGFITNKLYHLKLLTYCNTEELVEHVVCDPRKKDCMYGQCDECKLNNFPIITPYEPTTLVSYSQWVTEEKKCSETVSYKMTIKKEMEGTLESLLDLFNEQLSKFKRHVFNIRQQFAFSRALKKELSPDECIIHVDFSENYGCKYSSEIQAVHVGASHQQATLHTGVLYLGPIAKPICFSTVSPSRQKGPAAIWEHLRPVTNYIKQEHPTVKVLHLLSDGPCSQYRQRGNFYLFCTELYQRGFGKGTWNFFEANHGKGAPDGVGGVLKRLADDLVSKGSDIPDARSLFSALARTETSIKLFFVEEEDIEKAIQAMPPNIPPVPSTMRLHQVVTQDSGTLICRDVSCLCAATTKRLECQCPGSWAFTFLPDQTPSLPAVDWTRTDTIGKWCMVRYDGDIYPGIVTATDDTAIQVKCMHCGGPNKFYWPSHEDVIWYLHDDVLCFIPAPLPITGRHVAIQSDTWLDLTKK